MSVYGLLVNYTIFYKIYPIITPITINLWIHPQWEYNIIYVHSELNCLYRFIVHTMWRANLKYLNYILLSYLL